MTPPGTLLFNAETIAQRVQALGATLTEDYRDKVPLLVGVLRGVAPFFADLMRAMPIPLEIDFLAISPYRTGGPIARIQKDLDASIEGRHVILVEDVVDTGLSLRFFLRHLEARHPASVKVCTLIDKPTRRLVQRSIEYTGFSVEDIYLVGYGLDIDQKYRGLPDLWVIDPPSE